MEFKERGGGSEGEMGERGVERERKRERERERMICRMCDNSTV